VARSRTPPQWRLRRRSAILGDMVSAVAESPGSDKLPGTESRTFLKTVGSGARHSMRRCHSTNRAPSSHKSVSDSGSEMGVTVSAQVRSDAVSMSACSFLTSADVSHQVACTRASAVRDEEAAGSRASRWQRRA
jgi:hypothetical protein